MADINPGNPLAVLNYSSSRSTKTDRLEFDRETLGHASELLDQCHADLLDQFAASSPGDTTGTIASFLNFCEVLIKLADSNTSRELADLARRFQFQWRRRLLADRVDIENAVEGLGPYHALVKQILESAQAIANSEGHDEIAQGFGPPYAGAAAMVTATILDVRPDAVTVDIGLRSKGVIRVEKFYNSIGERNLREGDEVEVALDSIEGVADETKRLMEKGERAKVWDALSVAFKNGDIVTGQISGKVKGGYTVNIGSVRAFLPGSLVDIERVDNIASLGRELEFKIIKCLRVTNSVVVSRRHVLEEELSQERDALLTNLQEGMVVKGQVKNLVDYGAYVDLGGVDGLLHITDMSWKRITDPSEMVQAGQEVEVKVLKVDRGRMRVSLGLKQLDEDPWVDIARRYPKGTRLFGKVTKITDYGSFVEIEEGVEGLVHVSDMDWSNKNIAPANIVNVSDEVEVMVLDIDEERRRISLGIKQCSPSPWDEFAQNFQKGDRVRGSIKSISEFGIVIALDGGIDGLIHASDLSWDGDSEAILRTYSKGEAIEAMVLAIDPERQRISLGVKQMEQDPFTAYVVEHPRGQLVTGTVKEVTERGAVISLADGIEGYLRVSEISRERTEDARSVFSVGDEVTSRFIAMDRKNRSISLSIKAIKVMQVNQAKGDAKTDAASTSRSSSQVGTAAGE